MESDLFFPVYFFPHYFCYVVTRLSPHSRDMNTGGENLCRPFQSCLPHLTNQQERQTAQQRNGQRIEQHSTKENAEIINKHRKTCPLVRREIKIKTTMKYFYTTDRIANDKKTEYSNYWQECGTIGILIYFWPEYKSVQPP